MAESFRLEDVMQKTLTDTWDLFKNNFVLFVLAGLLTIVVSIVSLGLLYGPMTVGFIKLVEKCSLGQETSAIDVFDGFSRFGDSLIASFLIAIGVVIGLFLFVVPGLLFSLAMAFTFQAIAIDEETATGGMMKSFSIVTENFALSAMLLVIVVVLSVIGSSVVFGAILTMPFSLILLTLAYRRLRLD